MPACCLKDLISTLYFLPFSLILVCNIAKLLLIITHLFNQLTLMILFHLDVLFMQEILPDPEACTLVVLVYLLYEVLQEAPSCSVLQCEVLYCFVQPLLSLKIQSNMCLWQFLFVLLFLLELVLCLSIAIPCYTEHTGPNLFENFSSSIFLAGHISMFRCPPMEVEFKVPLEGLCHQLLYMLRWYWLHAFIFLLNFLFNLSIMGLHLNLCSLELFHDFHLHSYRFMGTTFAP